MMLYVVSQPYAHGADPREAITSTRLAAEA